jgi:hypothetical protein
MASQPNPLIEVQQGACENGNSWAMIADLLDVQPSRDVTYGNVLIYWYSLRHSGITLRVAIPVSDAARVHAETDACVEALADDEDDDEKG